jgi:hypothetical protein
MLAEKITGQHTEFNIGLWNLEFSRLREMTQVVDFQ